MILSILASFLFAFQVESASLWCYESKNNHTVTSLSSPLDLLKSPFNVTLRTIIFTFGYDGKVNGTETVAIIDAYNEYKQKNPINFLLLEWEKEASSKITGPNINHPTMEIQNAKKLGNQLGEVLFALSKYGLDLGKVHLIGHSLGAHLVGYAGKRTKQHGVQLYRITGLDPAGPLHTGSISIIRTLGRNDASFVDIVHTDPQYFATSRNIGDVDIWPNCDMKYQPGCLENSCSHIRSALLFAESVTYPSSFPAVAANSCHDWKKGHYNKQDIKYLGIPYVKQARGQFYLRTNSKPLYGKGMDGIYP